MIPNLRLDWFSIDPISLHVLVWKETDVHTRIIHISYTQLEFFFWMLQAQGPRQHFGSQLEGHDIHDIDCVMIPDMGRTLHVKVTQASYASCEHAFLVQFRSFIREATSSRSLSHWFLATYALRVTSQVWFLEHPQWFSEFFRMISATLADLTQTDGSSFVASGSQDEGSHGTKPGTPSEQVEWD